MTNLTSVSDTALQSSTNNSEITVNTYTGEVYISQRKAAEKLGIDQSTISRWYASQNYDVKQGLSSEIFNLCITHYALDSKAPTQKAKELLRMTSRAGTKAYLYHLAGYTIGVQQPKPTMTKQELLEDIKLDTKIEAERVKQAALRDKALASQLKLQALKEKYAEQSKVLHARTTKLLSQGALVKGDMTAGKLDMPTDTITNLLKEHGSTIEPKLANWALRQLGYLTKTHEVTDTGHYYGRNIKSSPRSKSTLSRWFPSEFPELLKQIESTIEDLVNN